MQYTIRRLQKRLHFVISLSKFQKNLPNFFFVSLLKLCKISNFVLRFI